jgi:hypothetical protein
VYERPCSQAAWRVDRWSIRTLSTPNTPVLLVSRFHSYRLKNGNEGKGPFNRRWGLRLLQIVVDYGSAWKTVIITAPDRLKYTAGKAGGAASQGLGVLNTLGHADAVPGGSCGWLGDHPDGRCGSQYL